MRGEEAPAEEKGGLAGKRLLVLLLFFLVPATLAILAAGAFLAYDFERYLSTPAFPSSAEVVYDLDAGKGLRAVAGDLSALGVIVRPRRFVLYGRLRGAEKKLLAGEYALSGTMTPREVMEHLLKGRVALHSFTVPEGWTVKRIAEAWEKQGFGKAREILDLNKDEAFRASLGIEASSLEGYLFPSTYKLAKGEGAASLLGRMVRETKNVLTPEILAEGKSLGLGSAHEILTLASIIEKETGRASERPLISAVFHNRLKKGMKLQSDPTTIYGIKDFKGNLKRRHLRERTPYNTYVIGGLPPGPIANPGRGAVEAAVAPADSDALFFVAKGNGAHVFTKTYAEHERMVVKYQRKGRPFKRRK